LRVRAERFTSQRAGAAKVKPFPPTTWGGSSAPPPPQPARMRAIARTIGLPRRARGKSRAQRKRKDALRMAKTKDKVYDAAGNVKPYVERAMKDEKLREDVMSAFATAKDLYRGLMAGR